MQPLLAWYDSLRKSWNRVCCLTYFIFITCLFIVINDKNCSLPIVLTATDQKLQKSQKGYATHH